MRYADFDQRLACLGALTGKSGLVRRVTSMEILAQVVLARRLLHGVQQTDRFVATPLRKSYDSIRIEDANPLGEHRGARRIDIGKVGISGHALQTPSACIPRRLCLNDVSAVCDWRLTNAAGFKAREFPAVAFVKSDRFVISFQSVEMHFRFALLSRPCAHSLNHEPSQSAPLESIHDVKAAEQRAIRRIGGFFGTYEPGGLLIDLGDENKTALFRRPGQERVPVRSVVQRNPLAQVLGGQERAISVAPTRRVQGGDDGAVVCRGST